MEYVKTEVGCPTEERDAGVALEIGEGVGAEIGETEIDTGGTEAETAIVTEETGNIPTEAVFKF